MRSIGIHDPAWQTTFPHWVTPREGEWLPGLLLRCDEANGWLSGTTSSFIAQYPGASELYLARSYIVAWHLQLERLAQLLAIPLNEVLATTFRPALQRLFQDERPQARSLGEEVSARICPACIEEAQLLRTSLALPYIKHCPVHHLVLQERCPCGERIRRFHSSAKPFTCSACGVDWANFARVPGEPSLLETEARYFSLYTLFLTEGTNLYINRIFDLIEEWHYYTFLFPGPLQDKHHHHNYGYVPLDDVVKILIDWGITAQYVALNANPIPMSAPVCLNPACPDYANEQTRNTEFYCDYHITDDAKDPVWFCKTCGSCFMNNRLCLSFDKDCIGDDPQVVYPLPQSVDLIQSRLEEWRMVIKTICKRMIARGQQIVLEEVLYQANISEIPLLFVPRLGLLQLVREYELLQQGQISRRVE